MDITYVKAPQRGVLYAKAREISLSNRIGTYTVEVTNDAGEVIAILQATA